MARSFAYLRVSTGEQNTDNQLLEIQSAGFNIDSNRIVAETVSGSIAAFQRKEFPKLVDRLEAGDILIVTKLDRLGRNAMDVRATVEKLACLNIKVHCLALGGVDLTSAAGKMTMSVIVSVAEFERDLLIERTRQGLLRAKAAGKKLGRPAVLSAAARASILRDKLAGASYGDLALQHGVTRSAIQHIVRSAQLSLKADQP